MNTMLKSNCGCNKPCGCGDNFITTAPPIDCPAQSCYRPNQCSETYPTECVIYNGDTIANLDIYKGQPLSEILQKLTLLIVNPSCAYPTSSCQSVLNFTSTLITNNLIQLYWNLSSTAINYQVEYRPITSPTWILNPITSGNIDTIAGLTPNIEYYIRVNALCSAGSCYSVTLSIKTKI